LNRLRKKEYEYKYIYIYIYIQDNKNECTKISSNAQESTNEEGTIVQVWQFSLLHITNCFKFELNGTFIF
jgi:hypothetical protein